MVQSCLLLRGGQETSQKVPPYLPGGGWLIRCWHYLEKLEMPQLQQSKMLIIRILGGQWVTVSGRWLSDGMIGPRTKQGSRAQPHFGVCHVAWLADWAPFGADIYRPKKKAVGWWEIMMFGAEKKVVETGFQDVWSLLLCTTGFPGCNLGRYPPPAKFTWNKNI